MSWLMSAVAVVRLASLSCVFDFFMMGDSYSLLLAGALVGLKQLSYLTEPACIEHPQHFLNLASFCWPLASGHPAKGPIAVLAGVTVSDVR